MGFIQSKIIQNTNWSITKNGDYITFSSPENDFYINLMEQKIDEEIDAEKIINILLNKLNTSFAYKIEKVTKIPSQTYDHVFNINFSIPPKESKFASGIVQILNKYAYISFLFGSKETLSKRGAQIQEILTGWKPNELIEEDLSLNRVEMLNNDKIKSLETFIHRGMNSLGIPGLALAIIHDDKIVYKNSFGVKRLGFDEKISTNTPFAIASITKPFTTLLMTKLIELKKLEWHTKIKEILPNFKLADEEFTNKLEIIHTASASTGMPRRDLDFIFNFKNATGELRVEEMAQMKPTTKLGETFQYSNYLVAIGGFAAAKTYSPNDDLTNAYKKALNDLILAPLGMSKTGIGFQDVEKLSPAYPHGINYQNEYQLMDISIENIVKGMEPAGAIWSTVEDLAKYICIELNEGKNSRGETLFEKETITKRREPGIKIAENIFYGTGLGIDRSKNITKIGHNGNTLGFTSDLVMIPEKKLGIIILVNAAYANAFVKSIFAKIYELMIDQKPSADETLNYVISSIEKNKNLIANQLVDKEKNISILTKLLGEYNCKILGEASIYCNDNKFYFDVGEWKSEIAIKKDSTGNLTIVMLSEPWGQDFEFVIGENNEIIIDDPQIKYIFERV